MKKKGFTLIELLAVIVILAVIMVIAVPKIIDVIENSRRSAAKSSAELYVDAIEYKTAVGSLNSNKYPDRDDYTYDEIKVDIKGEGPTSGIYSLKSGKVVSGNFCVNGYEVVFENRKATVLDKCPEGGVKLSGGIKLSSTSGNYIYPKAGTFEVEENISGGTLSCTSSDEEVATCSVSGTTVTVTPAQPKTEGGYAVLTIKSSETEKYKEASASYVVTTAAKLSVTANGYEGAYDGQEHSITVTCSDATITYGMVEGTYDLTESPKFIDAGNYTVYYKIEKEGYVTATGSETVIITKLNGNLTLPSESGEVYVSKSITLEVSDATGDITCEPSDTSLATCSVSGTTVTINGLSSGTTTITINSSESTNYNAISKNYSVTILKQLLSNVVKLGDYIKMTPTSTSYETDLNKTGWNEVQTINPSELDLWRVIKINSDGTIEMISENMTDFMINFVGKTGYKNYVGYLNILANQYQNSKYTIKARHIGYNGQTEFLTDTANTIDTTSTIPPWTSSSHDLYGVSHGNSYESKGGGDNLYIADINLVKNSLGTLYAQPKTGYNNSYYCLASRYYYGSDDSWNVGFYLLFVDSEEAGLANSLYSRYSNGSEWINYNYCNLRPIVTLKSGLTVTGSGTSESPYELD